jgi:hypothetical protein
MKPALLLILLTLAQPSDAATCLPTPEQEDAAWSQYVSRTSSIYAAWDRVRIPAEKAREEARTAADANYRSAVEAERDQERRDAASNKVRVAQWERERSAKFDAAKQAAQVTFLAAEREAQRAADEEKAVDAARLAKHIEANEARQAPLRANCAAAQKHLKEAREKCHAIQSWRNPEERAKYATCRATESAADRAQDEACSAARKAIIEGPKTALSGLKGSREIEEQRRAVVEKAKRERDAALAAASDDAYRKTPPRASREQVRDYSKATPAELARREAYEKANAAYEVATRDADAARRQMLAREALAYEAAMLPECSTWQKIRGQALDRHPLRARQQCVGGGVSPQAVAQCEHELLRGRP